MKGPSRSRPVAFLIGAVCASLLASPAHAQFVQQGPKLVASDAVPGASQGTSVAISADGTTAIVGGPDGTLGGAAWIWARDNAGGWTQQAKLVPSDAVTISGQNTALGPGTSVSISADGNTAAVGGPRDTANTGAVWIWTRTSGVWTQQGSKLVGTGGSGRTRQGSSLALAADGNTLIVGAAGDNNDVGAVWIWTRSGSVWTQQGGKLVGSGATGFANQGLSVALASDGNTAIVGGPFDNNNLGAAWIWIRSGGSWSQQGTKLVGSGSSITPYQAQAVSMAADGNTAIVGGYADTSGGAAWIWTRSAGTWAQQGSKLVGSGAAGSASQGCSVSLSADGGRALVGGCSDNINVGATWVWTQGSGAWTQLGAKLVGSGATIAAKQGYSVALSGDGATAIIGAPNDNVHNGAAWIFTAAASSAPVILTQPTSQASTAGAIVAFSAAAAGNPAPTVQWQISTDSGSSFADISGATSTTYSFTAAATSDGNRYRAVFTNSAGSATTEGARLTVATPSSPPSPTPPPSPSPPSPPTPPPAPSVPAIVTQPANQSVAAGDTASFAASATGHPTPVVQWQVSTNGGASFSDIAGATATTWSFVVAAADNGKRFRAVFTNSAGTSNTTDALLTVSPASPPSAPAIVMQPTNQRVAPGSTATFTAAATGTPTPVVKWQRLALDRATWFDLPAVTSPSLSFVTTRSDDGAQYRAVFTNASGSAATDVVSLTVSGGSAVSLDRTALMFAAVTNGGSFTSSTPPQTVRLSQAGSNTMSWTAVSNAPWLVVAPASGAGAANISISVKFVPGLAASQTGQIAVTVPGATNTLAPITVTLATVPSTDPVSPPFGSFDSPAGDGTVLYGSVAMTGWALDNLGVTRVELWRDVVAGEPAPPFASTPADPRNGKIFVSNATFIAGARPDVEALYPLQPLASRAGWGYLLLTWGLPNQGNGTYQFYAFAFDQEDGVTSLGTKAIVVNNNGATKPFGSIDTPAIGGNASGVTFGWAVTPKVNGAATCKIPSTGVQMSVDSGPLLPVVYGGARSDIAAAFAGFSNASAAGGHYVFNWSTLPNGLHTIGWLVTDDCNRADGIGSRFINVTTGTSLLADRSTASDTAIHVREVESTAPVMVARGFGELPLRVEADEAGSRTVDIRQGERIEMRLPQGFVSAYQLARDGERRALPLGSTWDSASGIFYWQPAPGFLGRYRLVFTTGTERISIRVVVTP